MRSFRRTVSVLALGLASSFLFGCTPGSETVEPGSGGDDDPSGTGSGGPTSGASSTGSGSSTEAAVGIVVVDVQETFVDGASNADMAGIINRTKALFELAADDEVPFFVTFEASQSGDHALHAPLVPALPGHAQDFIKTTFAATGQPSFAAAVQGAGLTHLVVIGAETDVCVMQTVLGLREMGFTVLLAQDTVFSEETNTSPALRRMQQAGTLLVDQAAVGGFVASPSTLPVDGDEPVTIVRPLEVGVVLHAFDDASYGANGDPLRTQKSARLRELLLVSEWFELPVYVADPAAGLPQELADYYWGTLRPLSQIGADTSVTQLVFAGTDAGVASAMSPWIGSHELYVMEDALLAAGSAGEQAAQLAPLYAGGLVPTTYKSFWYDMTKYVDTAEWPSQAWVARFDEYYEITQAPEDLPPITGD